MMISREMLMAMAETADKYKVSYYLCEDNKEFRMFSDAPTEDTTVIKISDEQAVRKCAEIIGEYCHKRFDDGNACWDCPLARVCDEPIKTWVGVINGGKNE